MKKILIFIFAFFQLNFSYGQVGKYLVVFKDKANSIYSINNPSQYLSARSIARRQKFSLPIIEQDLPPNKTYVDGLIANGANVWYTSKWLNAALILATEETINNILTLPYVKGIEYGDALDRNGTGNIGSKKMSKWALEIDNINYGSTAINQTQMLGANHLHNNNFKGEGMLIAVLDDGFASVDKSSTLAHLFTENKIIKTYDFVLNNTNVYNVGGHGHNVLSTMAARTNGVFVGTAPNASYILLRSENAPNERLIEEANYLFACEMADSLGADLINTSLGYSTYDFSGYDHNYADFDGNTVLSTRAADWAASKGILLCVSAGNSAGYCGSPADADSVLTVGAVNTNEIKASFSSYGLTVDNRIKPDIAAKGQSGIVSGYNVGSSTTNIYASSGTSFSSPTLCGFAACLWQANPTKNAQEIIQMIKMIGSQAAMPDALLGYGVPRVRLAFDKEQSSSYIINDGNFKSLLTVESNRVVAQVKINTLMAMPILFNYKNFIDNEVQLLPRPYITRHFEISPSIGNTNIASKIVLFFTQAEFNTYNAAINNTYTKLPTNSLDITAKSNIKILKVNGNGNNNADLASFTTIPEIIDPIDTEITWNNNEKIWEVAFDAVGFSNFFLSTDLTAQPLAVIIKSFKVKSKANSIEVIWENLQEINHQKYVVQKSINSVEFNDINEQIGNKSMKYSFEDFGIEIGKKYFYRLKMIDNNQNVSYSKVQAARISQKNTLDFNFNKNKILVVNRNTNKIVVNIRNTSGQLLWKTISNENNITIPSKYASQLLIISVSNDLITKSKKIFFNN